MPDGTSVDDMPEECWDKDGYVVDEYGAPACVFKVGGSCTIEENTYYSLEWRKEFNELRENNDIRFE